MSDESNEESKGSPLLTVFAVLFLFGTLAAIALPGYLRFGSKSKVSEVKTNLRAAYTAQKAYFAEKDVYDAKLATLGFKPDRGNRYAYFLATRGPVHRRDAEVEPPLAADAVIIGADRHRHASIPDFPGFAETGCPILACTGTTGARLSGPGLFNGDNGNGSVFMVAGAGNVDTDDALDCWSICSEERTAADGEKIPGGQPHCDRDDLR